MASASGVRGIDGEAGASLVEMLAVVAVVAVIASLSAPLSATAVDANRARLAAGFISARFQFARVDAVNRSSNVGVVFDLVAGKWEMRLCRDGNGNGLRRADIASGVDGCFEGPYQLSSMFPGVDVDVDARLVGPAGEPPNPDPVRFGPSDIASFSPLGTCTSGSVFLRTGKGLQYAVRIAGSNGRLRVFRYDLGAHLWSPL